jgi:hypothetical protein
MIRIASGIVKPHLGITYQAIAEQGYRVRSSICEIRKLFEASKVAVRLTLIRMRFAQTAKRIRARNCRSDQARSQSISGYSSGSEGRQTGRYLRVWQASVESEDAAAGKSVSSNLGVPDPENRDLRQLLWHRHRLVQMRTRIMNQLQALAMNEGYRWKKKLFSEQGRAQLEKLTLAPWASRRRQELLELLRAVTSV